MNQEVGEQFTSPGECTSAFRCNIHYTVRCQSQETSRCDKIKVCSINRVALVHFFFLSHFHFLLCLGVSSQLYVTETRRQFAVHGTKLICVSIVISFFNLIISGYSHECLVIRCNLLNVNVTLGFNKWFTCTECIATCNDRYNILIFTR